jgi:hypothetical protein
MSSELARTGTDLERFESNRWVLLRHARGVGRDVVLGTPAALIRTRARWATAGVVVPWLGTVAVLHAVGLTTAAVLGASAIAVPVGVWLLVQLLRSVHITSHAERVLRGRDARERALYGPVVDEDPGGWEVPADVPEPREPVPAVAEPRGRSWGPAWRDQVAITGQRLPAVPDGNPVRRYR